MTFTTIALSLFRNTRKFQKMHHLVILICGCINRLIGGVVILPQIPKHILQFFVGNSLTPLPHCHWCHFCKIKASALSIICHGHEVSPLLLGEYGYDATKSKVWGGTHSHHIITIHMWCILSLIFVLWQWCCHITTNCLEKPCGGASMWIWWKP